MTRLSLCEKMNYAKLSNEYISWWIKTKTLSQGDNDKFTSVPRENSSLPAQEVMSFK